VLPDNGLITGVARGHAPQGVWEISNPAINRPVISETFHGRDILAPAAAHLLRGGDPALLGAPVSKFVTLRNFEPSDDGSGFLGEVIFRDTFGNLITNVTASHLAGRRGDSWIVEIAGERIEGLSRTYGEQATGTLMALEGSSGWIEVAVVNGDAARQLTAGPGTTVWFRRKNSPAPS
jgi:S-adenosylmethionine hydrolase